MLRFIIETVAGRKGVKSFASQNDYINYMTRYGDKIKKIVEAELPYNDKPVDLPTISKSDGWAQVDSSELSDLTADAKATSLIPQNPQSVFKNTSQFEPSKNSESVNKTSEPKVEQSPVQSSNNGEYKEFKYDDNESSDNSDSKPSDNDKKDDKKAVKEGLGDFWENYLRNRDEDGYFRMLYTRYTGDTPEENPEEYERFVKYKLNDDYRYLYTKITGLKPEENPEEYERFVKYKVLKKKAVKEGLGDYLPKAGFIKDENNGEKMGAFVGQGTDNQIQKATIIAYVKGMNGDRFGRVTEDDLDNFDEYYDQYKAMVDSTDAELNEVFKSAGVVVESSCNEDSSEEGDGDIDPKTGKEQLFEEDPEEARARVEKKWNDYAQTDDFKKKIAEIDKEHDDFAKSPNAGKRMTPRPTKPTEEDLDHYYPPKEDDGTLIYAMYALRRAKDEVDIAEIGDDMSFTNGRYHRAYREWQYWYDEVKKRENNSEYSPADKGLNEGFFSSKLNQEDETMFVNEYFVYLLMIGYGLVEASHPTFQDIVKKLTKQDKRFAKINDALLNFIEDAKYKVPADQIGDVISRRAIQLGVSPTILDKAEETFKEEELPTYEKQQAMKKRNQQRDLFNLNGVEESAEEIEEEITPSRMWKYQESDDMDFAILSADRGERSPEENAKLEEELKKDVKSKGYWYTELKGGYVETGDNGERNPIDGENSIIVPNMTKDEAIELGQKYDQDTVMFKDAKAHTLQYIITSERLGNIGDIDSSFETQAGRKNFDVTHGSDLDYYSRMPKSNKPDLKMGFNWKE